MHGLPRQQQHDLTWRSQLPAETIEQTGHPSGDFTFGELLAEQDEEMPEIFRGVLAEQKLTIIGGPQKAAKTLCAINMALSAATGTTLLEHDAWSCDRPRKVLMHVAETSKRMVKRKLRAMAERKLSMLPPEQHAEFRRLAETNITINVTELPDISNAVEISQLARKVRSGGFELVVVDPLLQALSSIGKEIANATIVGPILLKAQRAFADAGATLVLCHHAADERALAPGWLSLRGLMYPSITRWVRTWFTLNQACPYDAEQRRSELCLHCGGSETSGGADYRVTIVEGRDHSQWACTVVARSQAIAAEEHQQQQEQFVQDPADLMAILERLRSAGQPLSIRALTNPESAHKVRDGLGAARVRQLLNDNVNRSIRLIPGTGPGRPDQYALIFPGSDP